MGHRAIIILYVAKWAIAQICLCETKYTRVHHFGEPLIGPKKSTQTFFVQSFSKTLRVMDVGAKNRGRPHQNVRFSAAPLMGRNFLTQGRPGVRVRNVCGKSGPKSLCLCCFFFPELPPWKSIARHGALSGLPGFHQQPQIANDLGRNVTHSSSNPHRNRKPFPKDPLSLGPGKNQ